MSSHNIVHIEFSASDPKNSGKFYGDVFGWKIEHMDEMNYVMYESEDGPGGGFSAVGENTKAGSVVVYISTDDIEASLSTVEAAGGKTIMPKTEIPMTGWFALFSDPAGNTVGLYTGMESSS